jgi:hypothetical protein
MGKALSVVVIPGSFENSCLFIHQRVMLSGRAFRIVAKPKIVSTHFAMGVKISATVVIGGLNIARIWDTRIVV